jgi:raffinose/stachyose/melibiose transport system permease protein
MGGLCSRRLRIPETKGMGNMSVFRARRIASTIPNYTILLLLLGFTLIPLLLLALNSFKSTTEIASNPFSLPREILFSNYSDAWREGNYAVTIRNSVILTVSTITATLLFAGMAAYALARLNLKGANVLSFYFLVGIGVPAQLFMIPLFFIWKRLGLIDSHVGLIIIYTALNGPFATYLLRSYMLSIPEEFIDAARIDGASNMQVFRRIIMPLSAPGFLTAGLIIGLGVWNEFLFAVTFLQGPELKPVSTSLYAFQERFGRDWGLTNAGSAIMMLPVLILFLILQRRFIEGLTQGGLKV